MSLSDRERAEGFHLLLFPAVTITPSERARGIHCPRCPARSLPGDEPREDARFDLPEVFADGGG